MIVAGVAVIHFGERVLDKTGQVDVEALDPVARLGRTGFGANGRPSWASREDCSVARRGASSP